MGLEMFGNDPNQWEFVCPSCGHVQSCQDFLDLGLWQRQVDRHAGYACIRRWTDQQCLHVGGPMIVHITDNEPPRPTFAWNQQ
tara:strand:+ start:6367 stop:6615 length:249 start_codon:yes stop_codon:yes gene_type:complete